MCCKKKWSGELSFRRVFPFFHLSFQISDLFVCLIREWKGDAEQLCFLFIMVIRDQTASIEVWASGEINWKNHPIRSTSFVFCFVKVIVTVTVIVIVIVMVIVMVIVIVIVTARILRLVLNC